MKKLSLLSAAALIVLSAFIFCACQPASKASGSRMLALNLEKGKNYDYEMVWDINQSFLGQDMKAGMSTLYTVNVTDEADAIKTMTVTYRKIHFRTDIMGNEISFDSDKAPASQGPDDPENKIMEMMSKLFTGMVGRKFTLTVNEQGDILEVGGFREMLEDMLKTMNLEGDDYEMGKTALNDQFDDEAIKGQFAQVLSFFPNKEVKAGDSWEKTFIMGGKKMPVRHSSIYKVKAVEGDHVSLYVTTLIEPSGEMAIHGSQTGNLLVDSKTGLVLSAAFDQEMEAEAMGMKIKITGKGKIKGSAKK